MSGRCDIRFTDQAEADLHEIGFWLRLESENVGRRFVAAVRMTAEDLAEFPNGGARVSFGDAEIRACRWTLVRGFRNHILIYRQIDEGIEIVRIVHGSQDLDALRMDS